MSGEQLLLQPRRLHAPEFVLGEWVNSRPLTMSGLRGRAALIDIWEMSCINCLRTLPYICEWHRRYDKWLTVIGVHTPEFPFAREKPQIEMAVRQQEITYPVYMDNNFAMWEAYAIRD